MVEVAPTLDHSSICSQLFHQKSFADVFITVENDEIPLHKVILMLSSDMLRNLWSGGWSDSNETRIDLSHLPIKKGPFNAVLKWCYGYPLLIDPANIHQILYISHYLLISPLEDFCSSFLKDKALSDPQFLTQPIKDATAIDDHWFLNELNVFAHIKDICLVPPFPLDFDLLSWLGININQTEEQISQFIGFISISCTKELLSEAELTRILKEFHHLFLIPSFVVLWKAFSESLYEQFPKKTASFLLEIVQEKLKSSSQLEIPFDLLHWFNYSFDSDSVITLITNQLPYCSENVKSNIELWNRDVSQSLLDKTSSETAFQTHLNKFSVYLNLFTVKEVWQLFEPIRSSFTSILISYFLDLVQKGYKNNHGCL
ncbi:hypothetical protein GEMRC1_010908 [Eukaryota sp. GEM-RC1]